VRINCASRPRDLLESTLFGHVRGSFTGATGTRKGAFEQAEGGILFLDEIGDLSLDLQPKLLHAVEEKKITPIGSSKSIPVSVKIVSATNQNLEEMVEKKSFRMDLFYRLNTMQIHIPPLRERCDDIVQLAEYFINIFCKEFNHPALTLHTDTARAMRHYSWPGNVRELRNVIERAVLSCRDSQITPAYLPRIFFENSQKQQIYKHTSLDMVAHEQELLLTALQQCKWNQSRAAERLNISRSALRYRLKKYGIKE
jgi:transcriptional regulator with PAS, ATPase and Fis domain